MRNMSDTQSIGLHWVSLPCHATSIGPPNAISTNSTAAAPTSARPEVLAPALAAVALDSREQSDSALIHLAASLSHATTEPAALRGGEARPADVLSAAAKHAPTMPPAAAAAAATSQPCVQVRVVQTNGEHFQCFYHAVGLSLGYQAQQLSGAADSAYTWPAFHQALRDGIESVQDNKVLDKIGFSPEDQKRAFGAVWGDSPDDRRKGYLASQLFQQHQWGGHREMHLLSLRLGINFRTYAFKGDELQGPSIHTAVVSAAGAGAGERRASHQVLLHHVGGVHWELIVLTVNSTEYLRWPLENSPLSDEQLQRAVYAHLAWRHGVAPEAVARLVPPTPVQMQTVAEGIDLRSVDSCSERSTSHLHKSTSSRVVPVAAGSATRKRKSATPTSGAGSVLADADEASTPFTSAAAAAPAVSKRSSAGQISAGKESCSFSRLAAGQPVMYDSTSDWEAGQYGRLRTRLLEHGFLLIRRAFDESVVARARQAFFSQLCREMCSAGATAEQPIASAIQPSGRKQQQQQQLPTSWAWDAETGVLDGKEDEKAKSLGLSDAMRKLYADEVTQFARKLCGNSAGALKRSFTVLTQCTWMRALREGGSTAEHSDLGFFLRRTDHLVEYYCRQADGASLAEDAAAAAAAAATAAVACCSSTKNTSIGRKGSPQPQYTCARCKHAFAAAKQKSLSLWLKNAELSAHMTRWHCDQCLEEPTPFYTCWTPLVDLKPESSRLQVLPLSHRTVSGYTQMKSAGSGDELPRGYSAGSRAEWVTAPADMRAGDLILFNWKLIHSATLHKDSCLRLSLDTRIVLEPEGLRGNGQEESSVVLDGAYYSGLDDLSCSSSVADAANSR